MPDPRSLQLPTRTIGGIQSPDPGGDFAGQLKLSDGLQPHERAGSLARAANVPIRSFDAGQMEDLGKLWGMEPGRVARIPAFYSPAGIGLNRAGAPWDDGARMAGHMKAYGDMFHFSSTDPDHYIHHELGHALHDRVEPDVFASKLKTPFTTSDQRFLARNVSQYGSTGPNEAVAEIYAGARGGRTFHPEVRGVLSKFGGSNMYDYMGDNHLLKFLRDESGALKVPTGQPGGEIPMPPPAGDSYRLSPSTGVPKTRSTPPPIGGPRINPTGAGPFDVGAPTASLPRVPSLAMPPPPLPTKYSAGDDLVAAYARMRPAMGFGDPGPPSMYTPQLRASQPPATTFIPDIVQASKHLPTTGGAGAAETPLTSMLSKVGRFGQQGFDVGGLKGLGGAAAIQAVAGAVNHPHESLQMATHPLETLQGMGSAAYNGLVHPSQTWQPGFEQGLTRILTGDAGPAEIAAGALDSSGMPSVAEAGYKMGGTLNQFIRHPINSLRQFNSGLGTIQRERENARAAARFD